MPRRVKRKNLERRSSNRYEILRQAVCRGDIEEAKSMIGTFGLSYSRGWLNGYNLLCEALRQQRPEMAKLLLTSGAKVDRKNQRFKETPLHLAARFGYTEVAWMLLDRNADECAMDEVYYRPFYRAVIENSIDVVKLFMMEETEMFDEPIPPQSVTVLLGAIEHGNLEMTKLLLNYGARVSVSGWVPSIDTFCTPLQLAVFRQNKYLVELLLSRGAAINATASDEKTPLHVAVDSGNEEIVALLLERGANINAKTEKNGVSALHIAVQAGCTRIIEILLANKIDCNIATKDGITALHCAAKKSNLTVVEILLKNGADCNIARKNGVTALHCAARKSDPTVVKMLLDNGANINATEIADLTALHIACEYNQYSIVKLLAERNADLNAMNMYDSSPLHIAVDYNHCSDLVEQLILLGANIEAENEYGRTALHLASAHGCVIAVEVLLRHGADVNRTCDGSLTPLDYTDLEDPDYYIEVIQGEWCYNREEVIDLLQKHIIAINALGFYVHEKNLKATDDLEKHCSFRNDCRAKVAEMKTEKIGDTCVTLYNVITANLNQLANYAKNDSIVESVANMGYDLRWQTYSNMLDRRIELGQKRKNLLSSSLKSLITLFGYRLPDVFAIEVFKYLSNEDLENLISADSSHKECDS